MITGGVFLFERPWKPSLSWRRSVWTSPLVQLTERHPDVKLWRICQWHWGCEAVKPTGVLTHGLPAFARSMYSRCDPDARYPIIHAIGRDTATGCFRTHNLKEYPSYLCRAFAGTIADQLKANLAESTGNAEDLVPGDFRYWAVEAAMACTEVRASAPICPDYQGN